ncbi:MAG: Epoxide hydrolase terminus [Chthonomonadaceae bacterium]|nr:Epoxide hydrolase terminus [Chthonomonadaceae bacterium]
MTQFAVSSSPVLSSFLATLATAGAFGLVLLSGPGYAQTVPAVDTRASVKSLLPANRHAATEAGANRPVRKETKMNSTLTRLEKDTTAIRPFRVSVPEEALVDLRRRIAATRWPDQETVTDQSQGVKLATMKALVRYWQADYDWRKVEAKLNALPQFVTNIDGLDIHFIHVKSRHANALPLIITHGWPGSIIEQLKVIGPLTDPTAFGGRAEDAFDVVIPSLPGYGFSGKPTATGWDPQRIARAWVVLMKRLGYKRFVAQGGDWGNAVSETMALEAPPELLGIHTNMAATVPANISKALAFNEAPPADLSPEERNAWNQLDFFNKKGLGYAIEMNTRPQTLYGLVDSPAGLAAWMLDHDARSQELIARVFDGKSEGLTRDDILDNVTLYWLTNTAISSARLYWDTAQVASGGFFDVRGVKIPVAVSVFPDEIYAAPRSWAEKAYPKLIYFNKLDKGGHFAAWEQPQLFSEEMRAAFRSLR